ncbi:pyridoxal phosphate-dependent transferase [Syncephalastrum racemosum]|uniref:Glutamate pyruvate transaminase n=1 Tax=Syncephalastrum racemosum TaxID=13706 RepID=A0A1X2HGI9_SYNRA|nr:pyridoxal phosphate-dependent transferase [Syncephalastrum racemosum]
MGKDGKILTVDTINPVVKKAEYAVRGKLAMRADEINQAILHGDTRYPFDKVAFCNIGNPQQLQQKPITFFRQVASLCENPELLEHPRRDLLKLYPADAIDRATTLLEHIGSIGAYSHSKGVPYIRENVAKFIERRDGYPADPHHIFLTQGASAGVQLIMQTITQSPSTGFLIPIPQYPLYSATLTLLDATPVPYYLYENKDWAMDVENLAGSLRTARDKGIDVRAMVVINPGNPTGQCLSQDTIRHVIEFCHKERIILLADEVYQTNIYYPEQRPFHSFKKVLRSMGAEYKDQELFSFHSVSKGMVGECGRRGGYVECTNIDDAVLDQLYKMASISLCPNVHGQIMVDLMTNPPKEGDPSYPRYREEYDAIFESLKRRAALLAQCFHHMEGMTCNDAEGALYVFPQIRLPKKALAAAKEAGLAPDAFYAFEMLEKTGVCVVPGSGFGQEPGTLHFRSTFLPPEELFTKFCARIETFHREFLDKYKD